MCSFVFAVMCVCECVYIALNIQVYIYYVVIHKENCTNNNNLT
jgi:hypothetical protein